MSGNEIFATIAVLSVFVHVCVMLWVVLARGRIMPMLLLNAFVAVVVLVWWATRLRYLLAGPVDGRALGVIGFEVLVLAAALWAVKGARVPRVISWIGFGVHSCVAVAALVFVLTFRFDRMM